MSASLTIHPREGHVSADVLTLRDTQQAFLVLRLAAGDVSIILDGYDAAAVASARAIIEALTGAIEQLAPAPRTDATTLALTYADGAA